MSALLAALFACTPSGATDTSGAGPDTGAPDTADTADTAETGGDPASCGAYAGIVAGRVWTFAVTDSTGTVGEQTSTVVDDDADPLTFTLVEDLAFDYGDWIWSRHRESTSVCTTAGWTQTQTDDLLDDGGARPTPSTQAYDPAVRPVPAVLAAGDSWSVATELTYQVGKEQPISGAFTYSYAATDGGPVDTPDGAVPTIKVRTTLSGGWWDTWYAEGLGQVKGADINGWAWALVSIEG